MGNQFSNIEESFNINSYYPIIRAWYGNPKYVWSTKQGLIVTDKIYNNIRRNTVRLKVSNALFTDPARGIRKMLIVEYYNNKNKKIVYGQYENKIMDIRNLKPKKITKNIKNFKQQRAKQLFNELEKNYNNKIDLYSTNKALLNNQQSTIKLKKKTIQEQQEKLQNYNNKTFLKHRLIKYNLEETALKNKVIFSLKLITLIILLVTAVLLYRKFY